VDLDLLAIRFSLGGAGGDLGFGVFSLDVVDYGGEEKCLGDVTGDCGWNAVVSEQ